jgi:hypothetical protein
MGSTAMQIEKSGKAVQNYHAAHCVDPTEVTSSDQQVRVAAHEVLSHAYLHPIWQESIWVRLEGLDVAKNVVPSVFFVHRK